MEKGGVALDNITEMLKGVLEGCVLEIISRDPEWNEGAARKQFLQILEAAGLEDQWTRAQRRRLSALLFT